MIDRETAVQWAKSEGFQQSYLSQGYWVATPEQIQALITRAQNEAYEESASRSECRRYMSENFVDLAQELRELIQELPK
jgi:hypothetical protein